MGVDRDGGLSVHRHMLCLCLYSCWRFIHYVCSYKSVHVLFFGHMSLSVYVLVMNMRKRCICITVYHRVLLHLHI